MKSVTVRKFISLGFILMIGKATAIFMNVVLARELGVEEFGTYTLLMSIIAMILLPVSSGFNTLVIREIPGFMTMKEIGSFLFFSLTYILTLSALILFVGIFSIDLFDFDFSPINWSIIVGIAMFRAVMILEGSLYNVYGKPELTHFPIQIISPLISMILIFYTKDINVFKVICIFLGSSLVTSIAFINIVFQRVKIISLWTLVWHDRWAKGFVYFGLMSSLVVINTELSVLILGLMSNEKAIGLYKVATQGGLILAVILSVINTVIIPKVMKLHKKGSYESAQYLLTLGVRFGVIIAMPIALLCGLYSEEIISLVFGDEYKSSSVAFNIIMAAQMINVASGSVGMLLNVIGFEKQALKSLVISQVVNLLCLLLLVPSYSYLGAAFSFFIGMFIWNALMIVELKKISNYKTWIK